MSEGITVRVLDTPRLRLRALRTQDADEIYAYGDNAASARVLAKTGMVREGRLAAWVVFPNLDGAAGDCWCYARVRR